MLVINKDQAIAYAMLSLFIGLVIGFFSGHAIKGALMQRAAIEAGVAQYNPQTAAFEFISPEKEKKSVR